MNRRTDLLVSISNYLNQKEDELKGFSFNVGEEKLKQLLQKMLKYYEVNDLETKYIHSKIFKDLYINASNKSYDEIALKYNIHVYTLDRYRQRYNKLAERLLKQTLK